MINRLTEGFSAKCDKKDCGRMMTFEYERSFESLIERMKEIGWRAFKRDDRWINYCPKCIASSSDEKDFFENKTIILDSEETDIIFRAKEFFKGINIFLEPRDVLKKIISDFGEELSMIEQDLKAEKHTPDLFSEKLCQDTCDAPLYNDMGIVKCQHCMKKVSDSRADEWIKYNTEEKK